MSAGVLQVGCHLGCQRPHKHGTLNPKVQGSIPCASTIFVSGDAPARQDVPFDADRCHQLRGELYTTNDFLHAQNALQRVKMPTIATH